MAIQIDKEKLKRDKPEVVETEEEKPRPVSAGVVEKALDLAFNPSDDKLPEVTIIDRVQGRLFPLLEVVISGRQYMMEIAQYRQDKDEYLKLYKRKQPTSPNLAKIFLQKTAQWQKSVEGTNLTKITDIALAEMEVRGQEEDIGGSADIWQE